MRHTTIHPPENHPTAYTVQEVATYLNLTTSTVSTWVHRQKFPAPDGPTKKPATWKPQTFINYLTQNNYYAPQEAPLTYHAYNINNGQPTHGYSLTNTDHYEGTTTFTYTLNDPTENLPHRITLACTENPADTHRIPRENLHHIYATYTGKTTDNGLELLINMGADRDTYLIDSATLATVLGQKLPYLSKYINTGAPTLDTETVPHRLILQTLKGPVLRPEESLSEAFILDTLENPSTTTAENTIGNHLRHLNAVRYWKTIELEFWETTPTRKLIEEGYIAPLNTYNTELEGNCHLYIPAVIPDLEAVKEKIVTLEEAALPAEQFRRFLEDQTVAPRSLLRYALFQNTDYHPFTLEEDQGTAHHQEFLDDLDVYSGKEIPALLCAIDPAEQFIPDEDGEYTYYYHVLTGTLGIKTSRAGRERQTYHFVHPAAFYEGRATSFDLTALSCPLYFDEISGRWIPFPEQRFGYDRYISEASVNRLVWVLDHLMGGIDPVELERLQGRRFDPKIMKPLQERPGIDAASVKAIIKEYEK